jgi:hypothetical protein
MKNVTVSVETATYNTSEADPDDSWDRPDTEQSIVGWHAEVTDLSADKNRYYWSESATAEVDDDATEVYVVVAQYSTGDTFGNDSGQIYLADVFDDENDARDLLDKFKEHDTRYDYRKVVPFSFNHNGKEYSIPWAGYFEHLENLHIETVEIS